MSELKNRIIELGGKEWSKHGMERVYIDCDILNVLREEKELPPVSFSYKSNKFFLDVNANAIMRSYKNKKPAVAIQY